MCNLPKLIHGDTLLTYEQSLICYCCNLLNRTNPPVVANTKDENSFPIVTRDNKLLIFNKTASRNCHRASLMSIRVSIPLVKVSLG